MSSEEEVPIVVVRADRRGDRREVAARGWGWPHEAPTSQASHNTLIAALEDVRASIDLDERELDEQVATLLVDAETREVLDWQLESDR